MSFILDALKKSENERQRQIGPSLADVRISRRAEDKPWWAVAVAALLVINIGVLLIVLNRSGDAGPAAVPPARAPSAQDPSPVASGFPGDARQYDSPRANGPAADAQSPARDNTRRAPSNATVRPLAYEADPYAAASDMPDPHLAAAAAVPEGPPLVRPIQAPTVAPLPPAPTADARSAQDNDEVLPSMSEVVAQGTPLPDLHLDIHVYASNPDNRFVFVNMRKYAEGQTLTEGPTVEKITREGVVLNQGGVRFLLLRP